METAMNDPMTDEHEPQESLWMRLLWMALISMLLGLVQTILPVLALIQFVFMVMRRGKPNVELAWFGKRLGDWVAKAISYQSAASEEKPWPWTPLD
jgi:hypothetical protein